MAPDARLYVVVDRTLAPGLQIAQAIHAARAFADRHPALEAAWFRASNTVAVLAARDEAHVRALLAEADGLGIPAAAFEEPDLHGRATAAAFAPVALAARLCRGLPPALAGTDR